MELILINERLRDRVVIKPGFDWLSFFSVSVYGLPHLLRKQYDVFFWVLVVNIFAAFMVITYIIANQPISYIFYIIHIAISIPLGVFGKKLYCKSLLGKGYNFLDEDFGAVMEYKKKWNIV